MSEPNFNVSSDSGAERRRDGGFTLPELLVSIVVLGSIVAVLASAIIVTFRQQDNTEGRLNVSRAEQNVSMWIPADLASAGSVPSTAANASPCSPTVSDTTGCPANIAALLTGSNALMLSWTDEQSTSSGPVTVATNVSYHFRQSENGLFELLRIECRSTEGGPWECESNSVLHDLPGPPPPGVFEPGVTEPSWVIIVSAPLPPDSTDPDDPPASTLPNSKNANRVVVTINGGGDGDGAGGGINQISITAGGTYRSELPPRSAAGALSFLETQSRCGGPVTLVVDESNSIGSAITSVKQGVTKFIETFAGTPVQLQVVRFHTTASVLGDSSAWRKYYDMTNEADVAALLAAVSQLQGSWSGGSNGGTNWEDAMFRTFYTPDASPTSNKPNTVVFFTDGVPTFDRLVHRGSPGGTDPSLADPLPGWPSSTGSSFSQIAFNRANFYATKWRSGQDTRLIGVGIGAGISASSNWMQNPQVGYHTEYQKQTGLVYQERANWTYEERSSWDEEYWDGNSWENTNKTTYHNNNTTPDSSDGWRRDDPSGSWVSMTKTQFHRNNTTNDSNDGVRRSNPSGSWVTITQASYNLNNVDGGESDGVRVTGTGSWVAITQAEYDANNSTSNESDGYRTVKAYSSPYTDFEPAVTQSVSNKTILARLIAGSDNGVEGIWNEAQQQYTNAAEANLYISPDWSRFTKALEAVALGECGGTLTVQTKLNGAAAVDPFTYQNSGVLDPDGNPLDIPKTVVTTNLVDRARTFDFDISDGTFRTVEIRPYDMSDLTQYTGGSWSCKAGITNRDIETFPIDGTPWSGFRVRVSANEAVSCIHSVTVS